MGFQGAVAAAQLVWLRNSAGGEKLSPEMLLLMVLVIEDGYLLFPSASERAARGIFPPALL